LQEKIIYLLNAIKFVKKRRLDETKEKAAESELALTRKLKWKGVKENVDKNEGPELSPKKFAGRERIIKAKENIEV
jgi:hypothetical protein